MRPNRHHQGTRTRPETEDHDHRPHTQARVAVVTGASSGIGEATARARAGNGVYAAPKWGVNGWSEALRQELLPDVRVTLIEPGVAATELPNHITHGDTREGVQEPYSRAEVTADDIAEVIGFVLSRPRHLAINEVLLRPAGQA